MRPSYSRCSSQSRTRNDTIVSMMTLAQLSGVTLTAAAFWSFAAILGLTALVSFVLYYHWVRYNPGIVSTVLVMAIYTVGAAGFLLSIFGLIAQL